MAVVTSSSAGARLAAGRAFVNRFPPDTELLLVAPTRGAADDLARDMSRRRSTFGLHRFSLVELAARAAAVGAAATGRTAGTAVSLEAVAARVAFDAVMDKDLVYFAPVASTPGFPKALARTIHELRLAAATSRVLAGAGSGAADVGRLLDAFDRCLRAAGVNDRAALFIAAAAAWQQSRWLGYPILMLDVPLNSAAERGFAAAILAGARDRLATCPVGDELTRAALRGLDLPAVELEDDASTDTDLGRLRRHIFMLDPPPAASPSGDVRLFSAPGEGREALEIARRALDEAAQRRAVRRDGGVSARAAAVSRPARARVRARRRAGVLRSRHAPARSGRTRVRRAAVVRVRGAVGASASTNTCRSARCRVSASRAPSERPAVPDDEAFARFGAACSGRADWRIPSSPMSATIPTTRRSSPGRCGRRGNGRSSSSSRRSSAGVDAPTASGAGGGGSTGWRPTTDCGSTELRREEPESPRIARFERDLRNLGHLRAFALPIIDALAEWPEQATWGEWLERFAALAPRVLRAARRACCRRWPNCGRWRRSGPCRSRRRATSCRIGCSTLDWEPPAQRYGRVFVGTPHQLRGRAFRVVFVPGLAERVFPQRVREDPLLLDDVRRARRAPALVTRPEADGRRTAAAEARDRRGDRAAVSVVSAARRARWATCARACRRSTRST